MHDNETEIMNHWFIDLEKIESWKSNAIQTQFIHYEEILITYTFTQKEISSNFYMGLYLYFNWLIKPAYLLKIATEIFQLIEGTSN